MKYRVMVMLEGQTIDGETRYYHAVASRNVHISLEDAQKEMHELQDDPRFAGEYFYIKELTGPAFNTYGGKKNDT